MKRFDDFMNGGSSKFSLPHLRGDVRQTAMSTVVEKNPCQFDKDSACSESEEDSDAVSALRHQQLAPTTQQFLETHHFHSAYDLVRDLLVTGHTDEAVALLSNDVFETGKDEVEYAVGYKAQFANRWYLEPAMRYVAHHREYEALSLFKQYIDIMRVPVSNGHWVSQPGIDATDIPVIADIFCKTGSQLAVDHCLLNLLSFVPTAADTGTNDLSLPLADYFVVWNWDGHSAPTPTHGTLSQDQSAAWSYAYAVRQLEGAFESNNCAAHVDQSAAILSALATKADSYEYFGGPARNRMEFVQRNHEAICHPAETKPNEDPDSSPVETPSTPGVS